MPGLAIGPFVYPGHKVVPLHVCRIAASYGLFSNRYFWISAFWLRIGNTRQSSVDGFRRIAPVIFEQEFHTLGIAAAASLENQPVLTIPRFHLGAVNDRVVDVANKIPPRHLDEIDSVLPIGRL